MTLSPLEHESRAMSEQKAVTVEKLHQEPAQITPMMMLQRAVELNADLDKLEKLMALQERWEKNEARKAYVVALSAFKAAPPSIRKNKKAGFTSRRTDAKTEYEYLTLPQAVQVIAPALSTHGLSHNWSVAQGDNRIRVTCTLTHNMGHSESVTLEAPADDSGSKNAIQAIGSTVTYLERYSLLAITGLSANDMDDDGGPLSETVTEEQLRDLEDLIEATSSDKDKFLVWLNVEKLADLRAEYYPKAVNALEAKRGKK